jgi:hypothetical protein
MGGRTGLVTSRGVTATPAMELRESRSGLWLRARRLRLALLVGLVESVLVLVGDSGWYWVLAAAAVAVAVYLFVGRNLRFHIGRELSWIAAASQLIAVLVPLLWVLVKAVAIVVLVVMAIVLLVMLLADRR